MKPLKEHILEGILDIENNINYDISKDVIEEFLKENYNINGSYSIKETKDKFIVDIKGDIIVKNKNIVALTNEFFEFGEISKFFGCDECKSLISLKGAPKKVGWSFYCSNCTSLKSLEGAPQEVGWSFICFRCDSLRSLEGSPQEVGKNFNCGECKSLKSLKGAPKKVGGYFYCNDCSTQFTEEDVRKYTKVKGDIYT